MIFESLSIVRDELQAYIRSLGDTGVNVVLENIALLESSNDTNLKEKLVITLVNIEEESTLKNFKNVVSVNGGQNYQEPPVHLNLYLLFCANFVGGTPPRNNYTLSLTRLSYVIQFFQTKRIFTLHNSPNASLAENEENLNNPALANLRLTMELYTLTFEQINHLWGALGGKQIPFAMYKARLVQIQDKARREAPIVEQIEGNSSSIIN